ncbi:MAG: hypothetical protein AAF126_15150 [Chloroflexota bacterium]
MKTAEQVSVYHHEMEKLLDYAEQRREMFGIIYKSPKQDSKDKAQKDAQKLGNAWLKANRPRIAENCAAIGVVTGSSDMMKLMKPIISLAMKRRMGTKGNIFHSTEEAQTWVLEHLSVTDQ